MKKRHKLGNYLLAFGLFLSGVTSEIIAAELPAHQTNSTNKFRQIEQPLGLKIAVTCGGIALIAAEIWWFLGKKSSKQ